MVRDLRVDLLALQEFTPSARDGLADKGVSAVLPYAQVHPVDGAGGSALYSRYPLRDSGVRVNPGGFTQAYATLTLAGAGSVQVESAHPCAPYALSQLTCWRDDLASQPRATPKGPLRILLGDFNATLDHRPLRALIESGYRDAADAVGSGLATSWGPYDGDLIPPISIDHVLVDRRVGVRAAHTRRLPGSDHRALFAELTLPPPPPMSRSTQRATSCGPLLLSNPATYDKLCRS